MNSASSPLGDSVLGDSVLGDSVLGDPEIPIRSFGPRGRSEVAGGAYPGCFKPTPLCLEQLSSIVPIDQLIVPHAVSAKDVQRTTDGDIDFS